MTKSPSWVHHAGKPVVSIWGIGFTQHPGTPETSLRLLQQLRAITPITFVGGVPTHWREGTGDSKPGYEIVYSAMDVLSPWLVGRYADDPGFDSNMKNIFVQDAKRLAQDKIGYAVTAGPLADGRSRSVLTPTALCAAAGGLPWLQLEQHDAHAQAAALRLQQDPAPRRKVLELPGCRLRRHGAPAAVHL